MSEVADGQPRSDLPYPHRWSHRKDRAELATAGTLQPKTTKEWWEVPCAVPRWEDMGPKSFEFDMPEHLPTSPMCPANKKHKLGGAGVCVYHGRRKGSSTPLAGEDEVLMDML